MVDRVLRIVEVIEWRCWVNWVGRVVGCRRSWRLACYYCSYLVSLFYWKCNSYFLYSSRLISYSNISPFHTVYFLHARCIRMISFRYREKYLSYFLSLFAEY